MLNLAWEPSKLLSSPTPSTMLLQASFAMCCLCLLTLMHLMMALSVPPFLWQICHENIPTFLSEQLQLFKVNVIIQYGLLYIPMRCKLKSRCDVLIKEIALITMWDNLHF